MVSNLLTIVSAGVLIQGGYDRQSPFAIVTADSIPLRPSPTMESSPSMYAPATLQLQLVDSLPDSQWYKVRIGENKGYHFGHGERFWVNRSDLTRPVSDDLRLTLDLSLFESPENDFTRHVTAHDFISSDGHLSSPFYVSGVMHVISFQPTCSSPFTVCGVIYLPGDYSVALLDRPHAAALYDRLYGDGVFKLLYRISAPKQIDAVRERLTIARVMMRDRGCYPAEYRGTEVLLLADTLRVVKSQTPEFFRTLSVEPLAAPSNAGEVQYLNLMAQLEIAYTDGDRDQLVRRVSFSWPGCL